MRSQRRSALLSTLLEQAQQSCTTCLLAGRHALCILKHGYTQCSYSLPAPHLPLLPASCLEQILESQLEKKAGSSHAPPANRQQIYFVDDLNMPRLDAYETAMPISLMRQHLGYGHWYDRTKLSLKTISGTQ